MPPSANILLDLPGFKLIEAVGQNVLTLRVEYTESVRCAWFKHDRLRIKDSFVRRIRHTMFGQRLTWIEVKAHKYCCYACGRYFNSRFPGILPRKQASEPCRSEVVNLHHNGHTQAYLKQQWQMGSATVERWYQDHFKVKNQELKGAFAPKVMGIDEHYFTKKDGFATTFADLSKHKVFDVRLGRSESSLRSYLRALPGKDQVRVILIDLCETYRSIAKKYFGNTLVVADRFHVIRLINQQFVKTWGELDGVGRKHRGLLSLMRRHPCNFKDEA